MPYFEEIFVVSIFFITQNKMKNLNDAISKAQFKTVLAQILTLSPTILLF